jgi:hypothetical protein
MLEAICLKEPYTFKPGRAIHLGLPQPATLAANFRGYGVPLFMHEFEDVLRMMLVDRVNESILSSHSSAIRCLSPAPQVAQGADYGQMSPGTDRHSGLNMGAFASSVQTMLTRHGRNPTGYHFLPYAVQYQQFGGDARSMVMPDMMEYFEKRLLRSMSIPMEFYDTSLSTAGQIIGMKLFQQRWRFFMVGMNDFLTAIARRVGEVQDWPDVTCTLAPSSTVFDPSTLNLEMNLNAAGKLSDDAIYERVGRDPAYERQRLEEQEDLRNVHAERRQREQQGGAENRNFLQAPSEAAQAQQQQAQQQQAQQGAPPPPPPAAPVPGKPATLSEMAAQAQQKAQELVSLPELDLRRELGRLKATDQDFYFQVTGYLEQMRRNAQTQGAQMLRSGQLPPQI